jgi:hypothetical protein
MSSNAYSNLNDHIAPMPIYILQRMDQIIDDGNLTTGRFVNTSIYGTDEGVFVYHWGGE